ncbi:hypothetical protein V1512DRAFT_268651 [Lipomyces arxii]|uniref:uncharacterized protein n=1 Tax=Lipomyces arxii TaxID=56418 RepID=UPI0034CE8DB5
MQALLGSGMRASYTLWHAKPIISKARLYSTQSLDELLTLTLKEIGEYANNESKKDMTNADATKSNKTTSEAGQHKEFSKFDKEKQLDYIGSLRDGWDYLKEEVPYGRPKPTFRHNDFNTRARPATRPPSRPHVGATMKEMSMFELLFEKVTDSTSADQIGKSRKKKGSSMIFQPRHNSRTTGMNIGGMAQRVKDPLSWTQVLSVRSGIEQYPPSMRGEQARRTDTNENSERVLSLRNAKSRMDACRTDVELDELLERDVYRPFKEAAEMFESTSKEMVMAPGIAQNYPLLLAHAIKIFALDFRDGSAALSVFERARKYGIQSYIFGCTTELYNYALQLKWDYFMDLFGCKSLLEEMIVNGIEADSRTETILQRIRQHVNDAESSAQGHLSILTREAMVAGASSRNIDFA